MMLRDQQALTSMMTNDEITLLAHIAGVDRLEIITKCARLNSGEPLAYIIGHKEFYCLDFEVTPATLIPRPETELIVETALPLIQQSQNPLIIDIGTGSGCIIISLAKHTKGTFYATDISRDALTIAQKNATQHGVTIQFSQGNLLDSLTKLDFSSFSDLIISANLPYIPTADYPMLSTQVHHEPKQALIGGTTGLELFEQLFTQIKALNLTIPYTILTEHQPDQHIPLAKLTQTILDPQSITCLQDLAGLDRVTVIHSKSIKS